MRFNGLFDKVAVKTGLGKLRIYIKFIAKTTTTSNLEFPPFLVILLINVEEKL